ncbi:menaquinol-cytochrome c reductase cytochrome b subunit [Bacillus fengqiuensis]|nr:menaquinol-cytochrome c reductase cytochrome b subunit [Bacillus fengqiuensis]
MKIMFQAFIGSIVIHFIYFVGMMLIGYIKTKYYKPDIASAWDEVETLQSEVAFGKVISPYFYLLSITGVTVICGIIIFSYKKIFN